MQIKNPKSKIKNVLLLLFLLPYSVQADSSLSHNVGNIEMLISDWGAFTRLESGEVYPNFRYSGRDYLDPFSEVWVRGSTGHVASAYDGFEGGISAGEWLATAPSGQVEYIPDHPNASQCIHTQYAADRYNDFPFNITVDQYTYAWDTNAYPDDSDYIIMKLMLTNQGSTGMEGVFLAVQTNWDVDYSEERDDLVDWDPQRQAGIAYDADGTDPVYVALSLISGKVASHNIVDVYTWEYLDSDRADLMSNGEIDDLETIKSVPGNYLNVISTGPYSVPVKGSVSVIYAFAAGQDLQRLTKNIDAAWKKIMVPGELTAESSAEAVHLKWSPGISSDVTAYRIYRSSTGGDGYSEIAQVSAEETTYTDASTRMGLVYYYIITAIGLDGVESARSNEVHASPGVAPPPPRDLAISGDNLPVLNWKPPVDEEIAGYIVYRNFTGSMPWTPIAKLDASVQSFADQNVYDGNTYYYTVAATNAYGWISEYSNIVSVAISFPKVQEPAANLGRVSVAPNPCRLSSGGKIRFINLTGRAKIRVYTASGALVRTLHHTDGTGTAEWDLRNDEGAALASGIYIYYVEAYEPETTGKLNASGKFALVR